MWSSRERGFQTADQGRRARNTSWRVGDFPTARRKFGRRLKSVSFRSRASPMNLAVRQLLGSLSVLVTLIGSLGAARPCGAGSAAGVNDEATTAMAMAHGHSSSANSMPMDRAVGEAAKSERERESGAIGPTEQSTPTQHVPSQACPGSSHCTTCAPIPRAVQVLSVAVVMTPPPQARVFTPRDLSHEPPRRPPKA